MKEAITYYLEKHGFEHFEPKAVLFDMDGVLYDSMPRHAVAWQQSMAYYGIRMTAEDAYLTEGQRGVDTIRQMVLRQQGRDISEQEAQVMYDRKTMEFHSQGNPPVMPGVLELMEQLTAAGLRIGVVTGSGQRPLIQRLLSDFGRYIDESRIVTAYDVKRGKPFPDPYLMGVGKVLGSEGKPWQAIVVENAPLGVRAAVAAQLFTIAVNTGVLPQEVLAREGADLLFPDMPSLARYFVANRQMVCAE